MVFRVLRNLLDLRATQLHDLTLRVKHLEDDLAALEAKHEKLRGRFYATARTHPTGPPQKVPREELLRRFRAGLPLLTPSEVKHDGDV